MWRTCWVLQPQGPSPRSASVLNCGRLPPPEFPACRGTPTLSAAPGRPACPSRASGWSSLTTPWGFPCFVRFPCVHAAANTPVYQRGVTFAQLAHHFSLPRYGSRAGLHIVLFQSFPAFTPSAASTPPLSPILLPSNPHLH